MPAGDAAEAAGDLRPPHALGLPPCTLLLNATTIRLRRDDADHVRDVVVELLTDHKQPGTVVRARNDAVTAQLTTEDLDLGLEESDAGVPASGASFDKEMSEDVEPP